MARDLTGQAFGKWTVQGESITTEQGERKWLCRCSCGTERYVLERSLLSGGSLSCGCLRKENATKAVSPDLTDQVFGELTALHRIPPKQGDKKTWWLCTSSAPPGPAVDHENSQEQPDPSSPQATESPTVPTEPTQPADPSEPEDDPLVSPGSSESLPQPEPDNPPTSEPEQETVPEPETTEPESPAFDVQVWVDFAISYGQQIGLEYDASATDCWDAPITASTQSKYLERDITARLNRYLEQGMTGFSVWAESRSDGKYNLFIGYR